MRTVRFFLLALLVLSCKTRRVESYQAPPPEPEPAPKVAPPAPPPVVVAQAPAPETHNQAGLSPYRGKKDAKATIVVFTDLQCPFCSKANATLREVRAVYGDELRIVWKDLPLSAIHKAALPAALAARAVRKQSDDQFFLFTDLVFSRQSEISSWVDAASFEPLVALVPGINLEQWRKDITDPELSKAIETDIALSKVFGVNGTPMFFINGEPFSGAQTKEKFMEVIDRQSSRAALLFASGIKPENLYSSLIEGGKTVRTKGDPAPTLYRVPVESVAAP
jgi:protein-disulfide isomerase